MAEYQNHGVLVPGYNLLWEAAVNPWQRCDVYFDSTVIKVTDAYVGFLLIEQIIDASVNPFSKPVTIFATEYSAKAYGDGVVVMNPTNQYTGLFDRDIRVRFYSTVNGLPFWMNLWCPD